MSNKYTIRARSLDIAMRRAREHFGANAVIVDTRNVTRKDATHMTMSAMVELTVIPPSHVSVDAVQARDATYQILKPKTALGPGVRRIQDEIGRIERLIKTVERAGTRLRALDTGYPLADALVAAGATPDGVRMLENLFEQHTPATNANDPGAAREHLAGLLRCTGAQSPAALTGAHVFMGSAGAGKTSLVIKLAAEMVRGGRRPAMVVAMPYHSGDVRRVEEAAYALMIDCVVARDYDEMEGALRLFSDADAVLVDTPCLLTRRGNAAARFFARLQDSDQMFKHDVTSMTSGIDFILGQLDLYRTYRCDYLALTRIDQARRCGHIVDLATGDGYTFSFVGYEEKEGPGVSVATAGLLIGLVLSHLAVKEDEGAA